MAFMREREFSLWVHGIKEGYLSGISPLSNYKAHQRDVEDGPHARCMFPRVRCPLHVFTSLGGGVHL